jgi:putative tricarboxylic transport membrane protein
MVFALFLKCLSRKRTKRKEVVTLKRADIIVGIIGVLLSGFVFMETVKFPEDKVLIMGPSFFPKLLATGLMVMSIILLIKALMGKSMQTNEKFDIKDPGIQRSGIALLATVIYCLLLPHLGFILDSTLYLVFLMYLLKQRSYIKMTLISLAVSLAVFAIFRIALNITLPLGFFG